MLAVPYRHKLLSRELLAPLGAVALALALPRRPLGVLRAGPAQPRRHPARGTSTHFDVYGFIPDVLTSNPFFGLGLNNFSVYYEFVTGRTNFGPHSFYVATLVETGTCRDGAFVAFLWHMFRRLAACARSDARSPRRGSGRWRGE